MTELHALILGIVQGVTEFLPISSSGHLVLLQKVWNIPDTDLLFITCLHLGTLLAVVWALRAEVRRLVRDPLGPEGQMIIVALLPTAVIGALFEELFEHLFQSAVTVGFELVVTGIILWWMDSAKEGWKGTGEVTFLDALLIGTLQGIAILPALSRSGLTIAGGLWRGLSRDYATRFSFLLSIPAILGATAVEFDDLLEHPNAAAHVPWVALLLGTAAAIVAGYAAVKGTLWLVKAARMRWFAVYVWLLAGFVFVDQLWLHRWFPPLA